MTSRRVGGSFRDPHGHVYTEQGSVYRRVEHSYATHYDALLSSGLYDELTTAGLLVAHQECDPAPGAYRVLRPEQIPFVSYPYEWCFSQLKAAALVTLAAQRSALRCGMTMQDASAYNVQFRGSRPVLIDTLSFEVTEEGRAWTAYGQFCRHFLAPLALAAHRDERLAGLLRVHLDGVPIDLAADLLPARTRARPGLMLHLHSHAKAATGGRRGSKGRGSQGRGSHGRERRFTARSFEGLIDSLTSAVESLSAPSADSGWSGYYAESPSYSAEADAARTGIVQSVLDELRPSTVWDLGANTGRLSRLASRAGAYTLSLDADHACVEANYAAALEENDAQLLPLVQDLTNPSPAIGWDHAERSSLADRGPADLVLALALVHHLGIGNNVPADRLAAFFARLGRRLLVEFVPRQDPMVQEMLAGRRDIFGDWTLPAFEAAFERRFVIEQRMPVAGSARVLLLMRTRS